MVNGVSEVEHSRAKCARLANLALTANCINLTPQLVDDIEWGVEYSVARTMRFEGVVIIVIVIGFHARNISAIQRKEGNMGNGTRDAFCSHV